MFGHPYCLLCKNVYNMKKIVAIIFCMLLITSCNRQTANRDNATCRIDLKKVDTPSFYDYFSRIEIIPLETSDESLIRDIGERLYHNGKYYIFDRPQKKILVFDRKGKFLYNIDKRGNGPGEYSDLSSFGFNSFTGDLELLSPMGGILRYDSLGQNFKEKIPLPLTVPAAQQFIALNKKTYLLFCAFREGNKMVVYDIEQHKIISELYDLPKFIFSDTFYHHTYSPFYICEGKVHFVQSYNGDVFTFENNSLVSEYCWDFGEQNFNISGLKKQPSDDYYMKYDRTIGAKYANSFVSYGENLRCYIANCSYDNKTWTLIYDKRSKKATVFNGFKEGHGCVPSFVDESGIYYIGAYPNYGLNVLNANELDADNRKIFNSIRDDDNPVVIKYVFK